MRKYVFLILFFSIYHLQAQEYFLTKSGSFLRSESKAQVKLQVDQLNTNTFELYYSERKGKRWSKKRFLQKAIQLSNKTYQISENKNMSKSYTREIISENGDIKTIHQFDKEGKLRSKTQALNVFPIERHGKTIWYDNDGLPMLEESYLLGHKINEAFLFNPVDSNLVITKSPEFPGGIKKFYIEIAKEIRYPVAQMKKREGGMVYVKFRINENGKISDVCTSQTKNSLTKELVRTVESIDETWLPAMSNGKKIPVWHYAKVSFIPEPFIF